MSPKVCLFSVTYTSCSHAAIFKGYFQVFLIQSIQDPQEVRYDHLSVFNEATGRTTCQVFVILIVLVGQRNFSLVCSALLERVRPDGQMTVILWKSVEMGDETSVVSLDCVIHRDTQWLFREPHEMQEKLLLSSCQVHTTHRGIRKWRSTKTVGHIHDLFSNETGLRRTTVKHPRCKLQVPWHFQSGGGDSQNPRNS